ncbi:hypothetical protein [Lacinutrix salivirga]
MKTQIKFTAFIVVLGLVTIFSKSIQHEIIDAYTHCVSYVDAFSIQPLGV